jgi:hypothetical protein
MDDVKITEIAERMARVLSNVHQTAISWPVDDVSDLSRILEALAKKLNPKQKFAIYVGIDSNSNIVVNLTTKERLGEKCAGSSTLAT